MKTFIRLAVALLLLAEVLSAPAAERVWDFEVRLDGKPIGSHRFVLDEHKDERVLTSTADFTVRFLGFVAYRYHHEDVEHWRGECLTRLEASTLDDGKPTRVQARADAGGPLRIEVNGTADKGSPAPTCLMSFAYWNPALRRLAPTQLLNAQNGRVETVQITRLADGPIDVRGASQPAQHWRITGVDAPIELWYADNGDWLALESQVRGGRTLQYRLNLNPESTACHDLEPPMTTGMSPIYTTHLSGENATHPIEPRFGALAALLLLVGGSPLRRRALPAHRIAAHSGASNCRI